MDADLADTLERLVAESGKSGLDETTPAVSDQKAIETWDELWQDWNGHVLDVGDEEGG